MDTYTTRQGTGGQFVTEADWIPSFWNFLLKLDRNDLIAELVQNDLDQVATRTVISFEEEHLVCEGNGNPVESDGWRRLRKIQGAGDRVPAKRGKIGVKNHGLKPLSRSATRFGCFPRDKQSSRPSMPVDGARIRIREHQQNRNRIRRRLSTGAASSSDTEMPISSRARARQSCLGRSARRTLTGCFESACASTPEQFAGVVSPEVAPRYEIVLRHWRLGRRGSYSLAHVHGRLPKASKSSAGAALSAEPPRRPAACKRKRSAASCRSRGD